MHARAHTHMHTHTHTARAHTHTHCMRTHTHTHTQHTHNACTHSTPTYTHTMHTHKHTQQCMHAHTHSTPIHTHTHTCFASGKEVCAILCRESQWVVRVEATKQHLLKTLSKERRDHVTIKLLANLWVSKIQTHHNIPLWYRDIADTLTTTQPDSHSAFV